MIYTQSGENLHSFILLKLKQRDRSIKEISDLLHKKGISSKDISLYIETLMKMGLLNNSRFTENKIYYRLKNKLWGIHKIRYELSESGISNEDIESELSKITKEEWIHSCKKLTKKFNIHLNKSELELQKGIHKLLNYGHDAMMIRLAFEDLNLKYTEIID